MSKLIEVKPKNKLKVFNPETRLFLKNGEFTVVSKSSYWIRVKKAGDIEVKDHKVKPKKESKKINKKVEVESKKENNKNNLSKEE